MAAANTFEAFRECIGRKVVGVLKDAMPPSERRLAVGTKTLVFKDGTGFTMASNGSYWRESKEQIDWAVRTLKRELEANERDIQDVLQVAGALA